MFNTPTQYPDKLSTGYRKFDIDNEFGPLSLSLFNPAVLLALLLYTGTAIPVAGK
jgi:hypothetical protein